MTALAMPFDLSTTVPPASLPLADVPATPRYGVDWERTPDPDDDPAATAPPLLAGEEAEDEVDAAGYDARTRRTQIWERFCAGKSLSAIARTLGLDRATVARHVHAIQDELADDERAIHRLALLQAVHAQLAIQSAALDAYRAEVEAEEDFRLACIAANERAAEIGAGARPDEEDPRAARRARAKRGGIVVEPPPAYRAQRARLLSVASNAAWRAALLQGLLPRAGAHVPASPSASEPPASAPRPPSASSKAAGRPVAGESRCASACPCACHHPRQRDGADVPNHPAAPPAVGLHFPYDHAAPARLPAGLQPASSPTANARQSPTSSALQRALDRVEHDKTCGKLLYACSPLR